MAAAEAVLIQAGIQSGLIDQRQLAQLQLQAKRERKPVLDYITQAGRFPIMALYRALAIIKEMPFVERKDLDIDLDLVKKFPQNTLERKHFIPAYYQGKLVMVLANPDDRSPQELCKRILNELCDLVVSDAGLIDGIIERTFSHTNNGQPDAIGFFNNLMKECYLRHVTDMHFEPEEMGMKVRLRIDGKMSEYERPVSIGLRDPLISRIKVLASLDIAEANMAQDGGFSYRISDWDLDEVDMRVATIPTRWGERITIRILGQDTADLSLAQLGMPNVVLDGFQAAINKPYGIILVTGPTGSGKSTTLYAALRELDSDDLNILTVEDPIEQVIDNIGQVQVSEKVSFAKALRSFLRHDPDVMLVGEIRDQETADTALKAAMTGHLVLSTLHTNDAVGAINRLVDIGCPRYLVASTLLGVVAQRLVRRLCANCKTTYQASDKEKVKLNCQESELVLHQANGCAQCLGSGYRGRVGLYETLWLDDDLEKLIAEGASEDQLVASSKNSDSYFRLWQDAKNKVYDGLTSLDEVMHLYQGAS
ncbi:MAG: type II/IV secretion system protein [Alteromonas sp.]|nr:type II/IV secretion system protein [Alteromonas sp.]